MCHGCRFPVRHLPLKHRGWWGTREGTGSSCENEQGTLLIKCARQVVVLIKLFMCTQTVGYFYGSGSYPTGYFAVVGLFVIAALYRLVKLWHCGKMPSVLLDTSK